MFYGWIKETAALIKSIDADHLVSTGSEGLKGCIERADCVIAAHEDVNVDYVTAHIWPQELELVRPTDLAGTYAEGERQVRDYISQHVGFARQLNKPLVIEEFGFPRDVGYEPGTPTTFKDRFYTLIYDAVAESAANNGPLVGSNFWAWNGEGRAQHSDHRFAVGDLSYVGDPPREPQGWYGVFDADAARVRWCRRTPPRSRRLCQRQHLTEH